MKIYGYGCEAIVNGELEATEIDPWEMNRYGDEVIDHAPGHWEEAFTSIRAAKRHPGGGDAERGFRSGADRRGPAVSRH